MKTPSPKNVFNYISSINKNYTNFNSGINISELRLALGSERLFREQSVKTLSQSWSSPKMNYSSSITKTGKNAELEKEFENLSTKELQGEGSIFEQKPFARFTSKFFKELLEKENLDKLIKIREDALEFRKNAEIEIMQEKLDQKRFSPNTFKSKRLALEKWVSHEKNEIESTKKQIEKGLLVALDTFSKTNRDLDLINKIKRSSFSDDDEEKYAFISEEMSVSKSWTNSFRKMSFDKNKGFTTPGSGKNIKIIDKYDISKEKKREDIKLTKSEQFTKLQGKLEEENERIQDEIVEESPEKIVKEEKFDEKKESVKFYQKEEKEEKEIIEDTIKIEDQIETQTKECLAPLTEARMAVEKRVENITEKILQNILSDFYQEISTKNKLQKSIQKLENQEAYQERAKKFSTNINAIDYYLSHLCALVKKEFIKNINIPYDADILSKLKIFNWNKYDLNNYDYQLYPPEILPMSLYIELEEYLKNNEDNINSMTMDLIHLHNKSIFDAMNEALEYFRPFDIRGRPLPWKTNLKKLTFSDINEDNIEIVLEQGKKKVIEWSLLMCGFLNDEEREERVNPDFVEQIREERMERNILNEIFESEEKWLCYDDDETVVQIEVADGILDELVGDALENLLRIKEKKM